MSPKHKSTKGTEVRCLAQLCFWKVPVNMQKQTKNQDQNTKLERSKQNTISLLLFVYLTPLKSLLSLPRTHWFFSNKLEVKNRNQETKWIKYTGNKQHEIESMNDNTEGEEGEGEGGSENDTKERSKECLVPFCIFRAAYAVQHLQKQERSKTEKRVMQVPVFRVSV